MPLSTMENDVGAYGLLLGKVVQNRNGIVYGVQAESGNVSACNKTIIVKNLTGMSAERE